MFTIDQIREAHAKVKSGADFPKYIGELRALGVIGYETFVTDGHTEYGGKDDYNIHSEARYPSMTIADAGDKDRFAHGLKIHQQGQTDYPTFCRHAAETGVEKWHVDIEAMTCSYYDRKGNTMLVEHIPG